MGRADEEKIGKLPAGYILEEKLGLAGMESPQTPENGREVLSLPEGFVLEDDVSIKSLEAPEESSEPGFSFEAFLRAMEHSGKPGAAIASRMAQTVIGGSREYAHGVEQAALGISKGVRGRIPVTDAVKEFGFGAANALLGIVGVGSAPVAVLPPEILEPVDDLLNKSIDRIGFMRLVRDEASTREYETIRELMKLGVYIGMGTAAKSAKVSTQEFIRSFDFGDAVDAGIKDFAKAYRVAPTMEEAITGFGKMVEQKVPLLTAAASGGETLVAGPAGLRPPTTLSRGRGVPDSFVNTFHAEDFGRIATPEQIEILKVRRLDQMAEVMQLMEKSSAEGLPRAERQAIRNEAGKIATQRGFAEEAIRARPAGLLPERAGAPPIERAPTTEFRVSPSEVQKYSDVKVYHGTFADFEGPFDPAFLGKATGAPSAKEGFFFASNKKVSESHASNIRKQMVAMSEAARVARKEIERLTNEEYSKVTSKLVQEELYNRPSGYSEDLKKQIDKNLRKIQQWEDFEATLENFPDAYSEKLARSGKVKEVTLDMKNPLVYDMKGEIPRSVSYYDLIQQAKSAGNDGVIIKNTYDGGTPGGGLLLTDVYVVFDAGQIKLEGKPITKPGTTIPVRATPVGETQRRPSGSFSDVKNRQVIQYPEGHIPEIPEKPPGLRDPKTGRFVSVEKYREALEKLKNPPAGEVSSTIIPGLTPTQVESLLTIGAYHLETGIRGFADFSVRMAEALGKEWEKLDENVKLTAFNYSMDRVTGAQLGGKVPEKVSKEWADTYAETVRRFKDAGAVKRTFDPMIQTAKSTAADAVFRQELKPEGLTEFVRSKVRELLEASPDFRGLPREQKAEIFNYLLREAKDLKYNEVIGEFFNKEARKVRDDLKAAQGGVEPQTARRSDISAIDLHTDTIPSLLEANFLNADTYIEKQGGAGAVLTRDIRTYYRDSAQMAGALEKELRPYLRQLGKRKNKALADEFVRLADEGGVSANPLVNEALGVWRRVAAEIFRQAKEVDLKEVYYDKASGEFKKRPIQERKSYFPHEFEFDAITRAAFRHEFIKSFAERQGVSLVEAERVYNNWVKTRIGVKYGHLEYAREFDAPGWKRSLEALPVYIERASRRITQARLFGEDYKLADALIDTIREGGGDYRFASAVFDRVVGREVFDKPLEKLLVEGSKYMNSWQVATKLGLLFLLNPTQIHNALVLSNLKSTAKTFVRAFTKPGELVRVADLAGSIIQSTIDMHLREMTGLEGIGTKVLKITKVPTQERILRTLSTNIGVSYYQEQMTIARNLKSRGKITQLDKHITQVQRWLDNLKADINFREAVDKGSLTQKQLLDIGYEFSRKSQFLTRPIDVPYIITDPRFKVFTLFKSFIAQQTKLLYDGVVKEATRGNFRPFIYIATVAPILGEVAQDIRSLITGRERPTWKDEPLQRYIENIATVGAMGIFYDIIDSARRDPVGLMKWTAGPFMGDISEAAWAMLEAGRGNTLPIMRFATRQVPAPVIQQLMTRSLKPDKDKKKTASERVKEARERRERERERRFR